MERYGRRVNRIVGVATLAVATGRHAVLGRPVTPNSIEPAARTKNMTHAALPRSEAFHLRLEVQARARNERQRGTIDLRVRQRSTSISLRLDNDNCGDKGNDSFDIKYMFSDILSNIRAFIIKINSIDPLVQQLWSLARLKAAELLRVARSPYTLLIHMRCHQPHLFVASVVQTSGVLAPEPACTATPEACEFNIAVKGAATQCCGYP
ncbi:hypothetical protein EVAR_13059_1 [Eumeta japonica]|uniref:Uncharacterized protein n=1 Tax=Eumeta variegata TaxID=151549 RepID=A0A4C1VHG6_EUMVA|nr:hypothetical protein EVAR_13059_1 [Eumeta japonica]